MRILILTQYFYPETGAPQNRLLELAKSLKKKGSDVRIVSAMPNYPKGKIFDEYAGNFFFREKIHDIDVIRFWIKASNSPKSLPRIFSMISFSATSMFSIGAVKSYKPDFLFVESPPLSLAFTAYILSKLSKSKLITNVSDLWPLTAKELGVISDGFVYDKLERLEKFVYKKSFLCSGQSEEIVEHIRKSGGKNVYLFRNGVEVGRFKNPNVDEDKQNTVKVVYAGLLGVAQGIFDIVKNVNFRELSAEFHIYGDGNEREQIQKFLSENKSTNIFLHKSVSREEMPPLLESFYCSIIPLVKKIHGAVPSKIYESMAAGLPVLFSGSGEGAKIISENKAGLTSMPGDFQSLKNNLIKLRDNVGLRNELAKNARRTAEEKFDRDKLCSDFVEKLESYLK